jgi:branched-chain amino acid transport system ATP-binding protein
MMPLLAIDSLNKNFGGLQVVKNVSLSVSAGEALAIIGPNGAGKTTFFNLLTGLLSPSSGQIRFKGADISRTAIDERARLGIARTMQITSIFPDLSVSDNVLTAVMRHDSAWMAYGLVSRRAVTLRERAHEFLTLVGLQQHASTRCGDLAYGDQRLVEIAVALGSRPELLLLDEPTAGLSPRESATVTAQLKKIHAQTGLALIVVEHDMGVVAQLARRVAVFHLGACIIDDETATVMRHPLVRDVYLGTDHDQA